MSEAVISCVSKALARYSVKGGIQSRKATTIAQVVNSNGILLISGRILENVFLNKKFRKILADKMGFEWEFLQTRSGNERSAT
jgi:hypothetical protein